jgi:type 1 glutamine amidotransferase
MPRPLFSIAAILLGLVTALGAAEPRRLLVVSTTAGSRHASIPKGERMLRELAAASSGRFTLTFVSDSPGYPFSRLAMPGAGSASISGFPGQVPAASAAQKDALLLASRPLPPLVAAVDAARREMVTVALSDTANLTAAARALADAELRLALSRADALAQVQATSERLSPALVQSLAGLAPAGGRGGGAPAAPDTAYEATHLLAQHLSPASLSGYDGIILLNTSGVLHLPDRAAFLRWVADGHAVIAIHAAMDTSYNSPDDLMGMLAGGARFATAPGGTSVERRVFRANATHPASRDWPDGIAVVDEFYQFHRPNPAVESTSIPGIDPARVQVLLEADDEGRRIPVAWSRQHESGRVFYTALGHRDDVLLPGTPALEGNAKLNPDTVSTAYRQHVLNGILWALGL